ncbi:MAG TPA: hypothetical protein VFQ75_10550 [Candidatus Limnocylindrales bacterium]|nr:hypothetical protein [Candidatus Limnocylindrales bacterium]
MRRGVLAGLGLAMVITGAASGGGRPPLVAGAYTYELNGGRSHVDLVAFAGVHGARGTLSFQGTFVDMGGSVTCVTVRGSDAWVAGVIEWGDDVGLDGWMVRVTDHGARDRAVTFIEDFGLATAWCEGASTAYDADYLQPVVAGWLIVR